MATMRDVAKLAGVSHGTVSNVLNGSPGVSLDKIERVQAAMRQLGYKQNTLARVMRSREVDTSIYLVLPDLDQALHRYLYTVINQLAAECELQVSLCLTEDKPYRESQILSNAQAFNMRNAILVTCQPENTALFDRLRSEGVTMLFLLRQVKGHAFLGLRMEPLLRYAIRRLIRQRTQRIALITGPRNYSFDLSCIDSYLHIFLEEQIPLRSEYIVTAENTIEGYMNGAIRLMNLPQPPEAILITDDHSAEGVRQALAVSGLSPHRAPKLIVLSGDSWPASRERESTLPLPSRRLAARAFSLLRELSRGTDGIPLPELIDAVTPPDDVILKKAGERKTIHILLPDSAVHVSMSTRSMLRDFTKRTGIHTKVDLVDYTHHLDFLEQNHRSFDVFAIDLAWAGELISHGYIEMLEPYLEDSGLDLSAFLGNILREYSYYDNKMYAVPYSYSAQLMLYRRDLFDSLKNKRHFYELTGKQLRVPRTWQEYNEVARFFTRSFNPESETLYGTTLGGNEYNGAALEYFPRMWGMAGQATDGDWINLSSPVALEALRNYTDCFKYAPPEALNWWWNEEVECFARGDAAMMIIFSEHASILWNRDMNSIAGKIGHSQVPDRYSVLGGWGLSISAQSKQKKEAFEFLKWNCSPSLAIPAAALGRILPYRCVRDSAGLAAQYPWLPDAFRAFDTIGRRTLPKDYKIPKGTIPALERVIGNAVAGVVSDHVTPEDALAKAASEFALLLKNCHETA